MYSIKKKTNKTQIYLTLLVFEIMIYINYLPFKDSNQKICNYVNKG